MSPETKPLSSETGFRVVRDHLAGESLFVGVALLLRDLACFNFQHVARRGLFDEVGRFGSDAKRRVDADLFCRRLGERRLKERLRLRQ